MVLTPWPALPKPIHLSNAESIARLGEVEVSTLERIDPGDPTGWPALAL